MITNFLNPQKRKFNFKFLLFSLIFLIILTIYLFTLSSTINLEDSAEFATSAAVLGIAHPPGYPLYSFLGHLFIKAIPFGDIAWRVNLMSAFFGALTCALLFLIILNIYQLAKIKPWQPAINLFSYFIAFSASLSLAFSLSFWSQSVIAEVYTLNSFFVALLIWLLLRWAQTVKGNTAANQPLNSKYLYWFAFLYGLSLTNHTMMILLAPAFLLFIILISGKKFFTNYKTVILLLLLWLVGLSFYLYLPVRSLANPSLDWGNPETWRAMWRHISRAQYHDLALTGQGSKLVLMESFFANLSKEFNLVTVLLALGGLLALASKRWRLGIWLGLIFLANSLGIILLRSFGWGLNVEKIYSVYYLPAYIVLMLGLAFALFYLVYYLIGLSAKFNFYLRQAVLALLIATLLIIPFSLMAKNYSFNRQRGFYLVKQWAQQALSSLPYGAVLIIKGEGVTGDAQSFSLAYMHKAENLRPDVLVIDDADVFKQPRGWHLPYDYFKQSFIEQQKFITRYFWRYAQINHRPLFTTFIVDTDNLTSRSNGVVNQVFSRTHVPPYLDNFYTFNVGHTLNTPINSLNNNLIKDFLASYYYSQASYLLEHGQKKDYLPFFLKAIDYDLEPFSNEYQSFVDHRSLLKK